MKVIGLKVSLEGDRNDLKELKSLAQALDKIGANSKYVEDLNAQIKALEASLKGASSASKKSQLPGGKQDRENVETLASLRRELNRIGQAGEGYEDLAKRAGELKAQQQLVNREIERQKQLFLANNESVGFYRQINAQLVIARENFRRLTKEEQQGDVGKELLRDIQRLNTELKQTDAQMGLYFRNIGNYGSAVNGLIRPLRGIAFEFAGIIGLAGGLDQIVEQNVALSDSISDVQKTTGLAQDTVRQLADRFRELDTRTTLQDLLAIAEGAGRLGLGENVEELEAFTVALDKVNVALGDVLEGDPDQIATDLAKISSTFGTDEVFGVAGGIERIGAAINLLGSSTKANENFILDATKRLQGVANTAGIAVPEILGLTATLDELALRSESSTSAVSKFIVEIAASPDKFARLAETVGITREQFEELTANNPNEAILTVLEASTSTESGLAALNDTLETLGISGVRSIETITALSQNVDVLRKNQALANEEFSKTAEEFQRQNSLYDEFQTKNENLAAAFDKLRNTLINLVTQSGVQDFLQSTIEAITRLALNLASLPKFLKDNRTEIALLIVALASFNAQAIAARLNTIRYALSQVTLSNAVKAARVAQIALNAAFTANPIGIVVGAVALLVAGFVQLYKRSQLVRDGVQALWGWVQQLWGSMVELYNTNILVRLAFQAFVEPIRFIIALFTDMEGAVQDFKDRVRLTATLVSEFVERLKLTFNALALAVKRAFTFGAENRQAITDQLKQIEQQVIESQERVDKAQLEYAKKSEEREMARLKREVEAKKKAGEEKVKIEQETNEEIDDESEKLTEQEIERRKRLREQLKAENQRRLKQELADRREAAAKIQDLEAELIENRFLREARQANIAAEREIASLVGDPEQIERQTELIREKLQQQYEKINADRVAAQQEVLQQIADFNDQVLQLQVAAGVGETEAAVSSVQNLFEFDESRLNIENDKARAAIERQFAANEITVTQYQERLQNLEREYQERRLEIFAERGAQQLTLEAQLFQQRLEQQEVQLQQELEQIEQARIKRDEALNEAFDRGDIGEDELETGLATSDELEYEQRLERERQFEQRRQEQAEEFAQKNLEFQEEIADKELMLIKDKNERAEEIEKRRRQLTLSYAEELSARVTQLVTGQVEDFKEFSKELLLLTLDVIEKTLLLYAAQSTGREIATKGFAGIATGAILAGIIKATFAGVKAVVQRFDEGGDIGGAPSFEGSAVPADGGLVNTGNLHAQKGIKGVGPDGQPIEIERGEFYMRNGPVTHIVNRQSARRYAGLLNQVQSSFSPQRFNSRRAAIARAVNVTRFQTGGDLAAANIPLIPPVSPRVVTAAASSAIVSSAADTVSTNAMMIELIEAINRRIDRIEVVNDPSATVRTGRTTIEVENRSNQ